MLNALLENLTNIGWAMLIFLCAYLANVAFSLWYNIKIRKEDFDREKLIASGLKILVFVVGLTLLCTAITALPIFANEVGWAIPDEYTDIFADLVIIGAVLLVSCKYIKEAFTKFVAILNTGSVENVENVSEPEATNAGKEQSQKPQDRHNHDSLCRRPVFGRNHGEHLRANFQTGVFKLRDRLRRQNRNVCGRKGPFLV